jgi:flagellum-specific ATP synthase
VTDGSEPSRPGAGGGLLAAAARPQLLGQVERIGQSEADVVGLRVGPGDLVEVGDGSPGAPGAPVLAEVVAVDGRRATVLPYGEFRGHRVGDPVEWVGAQMEVPVGAQLLGRVLDGLARPIDGGPRLERLATASIHNTPPSALSRPPVVEPMPVGVRAIDTLLTCGRGQRIAIMAGSGVGKSSLLSMLVRGSGADVNVLCLVGERGREVRQFLDDDLGPDGMARSIVVVATSDQPALVRRNAAYAATRIAEHFRDEGHHVNLLMDSVTRFAIAQREIGLAAGEIPTTRGFPPSALGLLPGLLERAGTSSTGSITGFYTVLVEGDDVNDPIGDTVRSIVDGHLVLSRELANAGHFPSIDVLASASRVALSVTDPAQQQLAAEVRRLLSIHERARDLIEVGAYAPGNDPELDRAVALAPTLERFRRQDLHDTCPADRSWSLLAGLLAADGEATGEPAAVPGFGPSPRTAGPAGGLDPFGGGDDRGRGPGLPGPAGAALGLGLGLGGVVPGVGAAGPGRASGALAGVGGPTGAGVER